MDKDKYLPAKAELKAGKDDSGKKVIINSVGGALKEVSGSVVFGPYTYEFTALTGGTSKDDRLRPQKFKSGTYWCVKLDGSLPRYLSFAAKELDFQ